MMRSMYSGVSGLRVHQTRMDVIGNNIANVNTVAFKAGRATFSDVFSQTSRGAGAPNADTGRGGTNAMQIGLGANVYSIDNLMMRGSVQRTDNPTDLAIDGEGFFVVRGGNTSAPMFTRAGNFTFDSVGNLVTPSGMNVLGWQRYSQDPVTGEYTYDTEQPLEALNIYEDEWNGNKRILAPSATTYANITGNLDADAIPSTDTTTGTTFTVPMIAYDEIGNSYDIDVVFTAGAAATDDSNRTREWTYTISGVAGSYKVAGADNTFPETGAGSISGVITFGTGNTTAPNESGSTDAKNGIVTGITHGGTEQTTLGPVEISILADDPSIASTLTFDIDFTKMTQYASQSNAKNSRIDGYSTGTWQTCSVGSDGVISAVYSNGQMKPIGQIALAMFDNPSGLLKEGDNLFSQTTNSGTFTKGVIPLSEGSGKIAPGTLEMSNVDLSREFSDMIVTQRGFQANTRIITTSDEMLQELVNLKR